MIGVADARQAGRDLDIQIAEQVMGWKPTETVGLWDLPEGGRVSVWNLPPYSTDMRAAWLVVDEMHRSGWSFALWSTHELSSVLPMPLAAFKRSVHPPSLYGDQGDLTASGSGETPALAICRAAISAREEARTDG